MRTARRTDHFCAEALGDSEGARVSGFVIVPALGTPATDAPAGVGLLANEGLAIATAGTGALICAASAAWALRWAMLDMPVAGDPAWGAVCGTRHIEHEGQPMPGRSALRLRSSLFWPGLAAVLLTATTAAAQPAACPPEPTRVVRSAGGVNDYLGSVPGIPELCRMTRADGTADFYFGVWRSDWPGAGQAYPAIKAVLTGGAGARASFVTRSVPGLQWTDIFINEGIEPIIVEGRTYQALKLAHERDGIEGNTYHSVITAWRDVATGINLKVVERQISGQSYGPDTTWNAVRVEPLR